MRTCILERADAVGGTWLFNRYPGARCDIESVEYSYSFSEEIQQEWTWSEVLPAQEEIERYLNFVADRLDLRRDIRFGTDVAAMAFDEDQRVWQLEHRGRRAVRGAVRHRRHRHPLVAGRPGHRRDGLVRRRLAVQQPLPARGLRLHRQARRRSSAPAPPACRRRRSSPRQAGHLYLFQRSAAYTMPANSRAVRARRVRGAAARYDEIRAAQRELVHRRGPAQRLLRPASRSVDQPPLKTATREEQLRAIDERGVNGALLWGDVLFDIEANRMATALYGEAVARIVEDPATAASLVPDYPFACKRPIIDDGYYETFNRDNVTLVDLQQGPDPDGHAHGHRDRAGLVRARRDPLRHRLRRHHRRAQPHGDRAAATASNLRDVWTDGGTAVVPRPPGRRASRTCSPSRARAARRRSTNFVAALEQHVEWIGDCLGLPARATATARSRRSPAAQLEWAAHAASLVEGSILLDPVLQLLVQRRQRARQEAGLPRLPRRHPRVPRPLRRDRRRRLRRLRADAEAPMPFLRPRRRPPVLHRRRRGRRPRSCSCTATRADSHDWSWQLPHFAADHRVIAVDLRGHGASSAPAGGYTTAQFAGDLVGAARPPRRRSRSWRSATRWAAASSARSPSSTPSGSRRSWPSTRPTCSPTRWPAPLGPVLDGARRRRRRARSCRRIVGDGMASPARDPGLRTWQVRRIAARRAARAPAVAAGPGLGHGAALGERALPPAAAVPGARRSTPIRSGARSRRRLFADDRSHVVTWEGSGHWLQQERSAELNALVGDLAGRHHMSESDPIEHPSRFAASAPDRPGGHPRRRPARS